MECCVSELPEPLSPSDSHYRRWLEDQAKEAARARREQEAVLRSMYRDSLKGRQP
jgi:hypothetical protein